MLGIVPSYHCMQLQGKLINQTSENDKKPNFGPDFGPLGSNSDCQFFFFLIWLRQPLDIIVSYHHVQYQKNLMIQSLGNLVMDRHTDGRE